MAEKPTTRKNTTGSGNKYQIPGALDYRDKVYLKQSAQRRTAGSRTAGTNTAGGSAAAGGRAAGVTGAGRSYGTGKRKKKSSVGVLLGILCGSLGVIFMLLLVLIVRFAGNNDKKAGISGTEVPTTGAPFVQDKNEKEEYLSINGESCTVYIGQQFQLTVSAYPADLADSVVWSSNNEQVVLVDERGNVRIVGEGIAAITATSGSYADAIAVEAVTDAMAEVSMGFPLYSKVDGTGQSGPMGPVTPTPQIKPNTSGDGSGNNAGNEGESYPDGSNMGGQGTSSNPQGQEPGTTLPDNPGDSSVTPASPPTAAENPTTQNSGNPNDGTKPVEPTQNTEQPAQNTEQPTQSREEPEQPYVPPETEPAPAIDTAEMFSLLSSSGFSQYLSNACIYEKDGEYQGEIIVASDSVHIYIKERSAEFDQAVKNTLAYLLPNTSDTVWNSYVAAASDRTISSDGRKVRFVMAAVDAHSQIIVYNP